MKINLSIIPEDGQTWSVNQSTKELNQALRDIIGPATYQAQFTIRPLQASSTYEMIGSIKTELPEQCSRCGLDFKMPIDTKFNHLLMPALEVPRDGKFSKPNHLSDLNESELDVAEYQDETFDAGEFFHEIVALAEPFTPVPCQDKEGNCVLCKISVKSQNFSYVEEMETKNTPFATLKGVKINS